MTGYIEDLTKDQVESVTRLAVAVQAVAAIVLRDPLHAGAGVLGCGLQMLVEQGVTEAEALQIVETWFASHGDVRARMARMQMQLVPEPEIE